MRIVTIVLLILCCVLFYNNQEPIVSCTMSVAVFLSYYFLEKQAIAYSLYKIYYLFSLFFLCIAPFYQFTTQTLIWSSQRIDSEWFFYTTLLVLVAEILFYIGYNVRSGPKKVVEYFDVMTISTLSLIVLVSISSLSCLFVLYIYNFNTIALLFRGGIQMHDGYNNQIFGLLLGNFIRPLPLIIFLQFKLIENKKNLVFYLLAILALVTISPTGIARLQAAALYIPVLLLFVKKVSCRNNFTYLFVFGLLLIFPFLNQFRHFGNDLTLSFGLNFDMFLEGHFDAYQNFLLVIQNDVITYGFQLLGPVFFWIPRSVWAGKPIGSGAFVADKLNLYFDNISMPFVAEGYVNFGIIGVLLFSFVLGFICAKLDYQYWILKNNTVSFKLVYLILLGMLFFMLRGDLMSSTAFTLGLVSAVYFVENVIKYFNKISYR